MAETASRTDAACHIIDCSGAVAVKLDGRVEGLYIGHRYRSCEQFADLLDALLDHDPLRQFWEEGSYETLIEHITLAECEQVYARALEHGTRT